MIGSFKFNEVESSSFDLVCKSVKRPLLPAVKVRRIDLVGASGVYDFDDYEYNLRAVTMKIQYIGTSYEELRTRARDIAAWLSVSSWSKLIINDETDKYYLAKVTNEIDLESLWGSGSADIVFDCQPFAYSVTEEEVEFTGIVTTTSCEFTNPGNRIINYRSPLSSKSRITIAGSFTTLSLMLNGKVLMHNEALTGTLIIDNIEMEASVGGTNHFGKLAGDVDTFLPIIAGDNTLTVGGSGLNVTVTINYIPLWI